MIENLYEESDEAYQKIKQSTKTLLTAVRKEEKKVNNIIKQTEKMLRQEDCDDEEC